MEEAQPLVELVIHDAEWTGVMSENDWLKKINYWYGFVLPKIRHDKILSVCLTNNQEIQALNAYYRKKDKPTNVLAFPQDSSDLWGDIVMAYQIIKKEAEEEGKTFIKHITHLFIHGCLHLQGYDHEEEKEQAKMEAREISILKELGVENPYE